MYECAVSWNWLLSFVDKHKTTLKSLSTQKVVTKLIIPATEKDKTRYVDLLPPHQVALPNYFVSHVWSAPFLDLIESLKQYVDSTKRTKDVFVWIDIFAVDQHRDSGTQGSDLSHRKTVFPSPPGTVRVREICL